MQKKSVILLNRLRVRLAERHAPAWIINRISAYVVRNWRDEA